MNIQERRAELGVRDPDDLACEIVNRELNDFVARHADYEPGDSEPDPHGHGKRVPYIGWFWRDVDFAREYYVIGNCGQFIGFMENNKWGYPQRRLIPSEAEQITKIVQDALGLSRAGGQLSVTLANARSKLEEIWPLMQTFPMQIEGFWILGPQGTVGFSETEEDANRTIESLTDAAPDLKYWHRPVTVD